VLGRAATFVLLVWLTWIGVRPPRVIRASLVCTRVEAM
jgi:hypothetical protein